MTRRDYILISRTLLDFKKSMVDPHGTTSQEAYWVLCTDFANALADENPRFDHDRFLQACEAEHA
jgi:hypothetical protein